MSNKETLNKLVEVTEELGLYDQPVTKDEALKLALEALESMSGTILELGEQTTFNEDQAIAAIKEALAQPAQELDWKNQYEKQKRRAEMWIAKYEKDIGPLEYAVPVAQPAQEMVATMTVEDGRISFAAEILPDGTYDLYTAPPAAQPAQENT